MISAPRAWLHFAAIGGLLFAVDRFLWPTDFATAATARIGLAPGVDWASTSADELLYREALRRGLDRGDSVIRQRLIRNMRFLDPAGSSSENGENGEAADAEALYLEALELGFDRSDLVVRRRLVERMRQTLIAERAIASPDDAALRAHLREKPERFAQAPRRRIEQLYYASEVRARQALAVLSHPAERAGAAGVKVDSLPIPRNLPSLSERELAARLGEGFASEVFALPVDRSGDGWSGPMVSSYGAHLVRIHERTAARAPTLDELRPALTSDWIADREERALHVAIAELRRAYARPSAGALP